MARIAGHYVHASGMLLFAAEAAVVGLAARFGWQLGAAPPDAPMLAITVACAVVLQIAFYWADLYDVRVAASDVRGGKRLLFAVGATMAIAAPVTLLAPAEARTAVPFAMAAAAVGAAALRALAPWEPLRRRLLVVGHGRALDTLLAELAVGEDFVLDVARERDTDLVARARQLGAHAVVTAFDDGRAAIPVDRLLACRFAGVEVVEALSYVQRARRKVPVELLRPDALVYDDGFTAGAISVAGHRAISLIFGTLLLVLIAPVAAAIALAISLDSPGPILYRQVRVGRGGRPFSMWKFRTMRVDAEAGTGAVWAKKNDPRVTRIGNLLRRTRLDELPQLFNVLRGDMDLVGPRPERPEFVAMLKKHIPFYEVRQLVRPGLTGWAQIGYPYGASIEDARQKLAYDIYYVKHASPILDLIVLFHTAKVVIMGRGAR
jgi:exopolysaccharide biosynthesis polyprenyl glycosylphosphotransferase